MKLNIRTIVFAIIIACSTALNAQQVNTMYFLENAPMRHLINPAFQPASKVYITLPAIGYTSLGAGNNVFAINSLIFKDPTTGNTITALHPNADGKLWKKLPKNTVINTEAYVNLLGLGFRIKEAGYFHLNLAERLDVGIGIPNQVFGILHGQQITQLDLSRLNVSATAYTELAFGYSHRINEKWSVGAKLKLLSGQAYVSGRFSSLELNSSPELASLVGRGELALGGWANPNHFPPEMVATIDYLQKLAPSVFGGATELGGAVDLGFTYKPIKNLQVTAAVTDLGFINWKKSVSSAVSIDTTFNGFIHAELGDYMQDGVFLVDTLMANVGNNLNAYADVLQTSPLMDCSFNRMLTANLNVGIDANFWKNRIGVGVYSRTRIYNKQITEEVTIGAALRPCNWFNLAASYSFINGRWGNMGAAMSFAPYDGIMLTVAADYIPLVYADASIKNTVVPLPYKTSGVNLALGVAIVAGTNNKIKKEKEKKEKLKDSDKDGIIDDFDLCPNTPKKVEVDKMGCPFDTDGDGVADYMDECSNTPAAAYGMIDSVGCPIDSDNDGVADYIDLCPDTPEDEIAYVNQWGCPYDTDGDGITDHLDECEDTPIEARGLVDEKGCPIDTDGDGIPDYLDECPNTPGTWENMGCPEIEQKAQATVQEAMDGIYFDTGKTTIKKQSYAVLNQLAETLLSNPHYHLIIVGHTDNVGSYKTNKELSLRRAIAVRNYLRQKGVSDKSLSLTGYGYKRPIASNATASGRAKNRRVELTLTYIE